jgi:hypothetical protein
MMINWFNIALLLVANLAQAYASTPSSSLRVTREVATLHRDALIKAVHEKARKLVDSSSANGESFGDDETFCNYVEEIMSFEEAGSKNAAGDCSCSGTIADTLELTCSFQNVCGERGAVCGSLDFVLKLSNPVDEEGNLGNNLEMEIQACVDVDAEWLEEICLTLFFSGMDFFAPVKCEMTYDMQECMCNIDTVQVDETFDIEVPCMVWNCSDVVPDPLKPYMAQDNCELFSDTDSETVTAVEPVLTSFAALEEVPPEVTTQLQAGSGAISTRMTVQGTSISVVLSAAFLALL